MKIKAVLLDLDGTLRDTREAIYGAYQHAIKEHSGRDVARDEIKPYVHHHTVVHQAFASHASADAFTTTYMDEVYKNFADVKLYEGVEALLESLRTAGYRLAIVTSATQDRTEQFLQQQGLAGWFQAIVGMTPDRRPKPDPDLLQVALEKLGCKPREAIMLGDMTVDIMAAHAAGLPCVAITHGFASQRELQKAGADYIIDSLEPLPQLLNSIE